MKHRSRFLARTVGWGVAAALALAALTPMDADARGKRWKKHRRYEPRRVMVVQPRPVYERYYYSCEPAPIHRSIIRYEGDQFHWSAAVGFYVPDMWLNVGIGNAPPRGMVYYDPYCDRSFASLRLYRGHLERGRHPEVLSFRAVAYGSGHDVCGCGYDGPHDHDHAEWYDD
jgi:hypothetical protein